jgi:hypothetical protein
MGDWPIRNAGSLAKLGHQVWRRRRRVGNARLAAYEPDGSLRPANQSSCCRPGRFTGRPSRWRLEPEPTARREIIRARETPRGRSTSRRNWEAARLYAAQERVQGSCDPLTARVGRERVLRPLAGEYGPRNSAGRPWNACRRAHRREVRNTGWRREWSDGAQVALTHTGRAAS